MRNPLRGARYANVTATLALVVALGGTGYAAATIGTGDIQNNAVTSAKIKNENIKTIDLKKNAITSLRVKNDALTGVDIDESTLGQVPSAASAHDVTDIVMQNIPLLNGWTPWTVSRGAKFGIDADGVVHLKGGVQQAGAFNPIIGVLPVGYRPIGGLAYVSTNLVAASGPARVYIDTDGTIRVQASAPATNVDAQNFTSLDGVSFVP